MYGRPPSVFGSVFQIGSFDLLPAPGVGSRYRITHLYAAPNTGAAFVNLELTIQDGAGLIVWSAMWGGGGGAWSPASIVFPQPGILLGVNQTLHLAAAGAAIHFDIGGGYFTDAA